MRDLGRRTGVAGQSGPARESEWQSRLSESASEQGRAGRHVGNDPRRRRGYSRRKKYTEGPPICHRVTKSCLNRKTGYNAQNQCKLGP